MADRKEYVTWASTLVLLTREEAEAQALQRMEGSNSPVLILRVVARTVRMPGFVTPFIGEPK